MSAKQQIWDEELKDVIQAADLLVPKEAIAADAEYLGIKDYIEIEENEGTIDSHAINVYTGKELNSVKTFSSINASIKSIQSDTQSTTNIQKEEQGNSNHDLNINNLNSTLLHIKKTISVLDANIKNNNHESEEILGKLIVLEKFMKNQEPNNTNLTSTNPGSTNVFPGDQN
jgi:hypothetical protein